MSVIDRERLVATARHYAEVTDRLDEDMDACHAHCIDAALEPAAACEIPPEDIPSADEAALSCFERCLPITWAVGTMLDEEGVPPRTAPFCYGMYVDAHICWDDFMISCSESPEEMAACQAKADELNEKCPLDR